jgi:hypothetical protein
VAVNAARGPSIDAAVPPSSCPGRAHSAEAPRPGLRTTKGNEQFNQAVGSYSLYLVVDDPDAHHIRAKQTGAEILLGLKDEDYGSRGYTARVPASGTPRRPGPVTTKRCRA